MTENRPSSSRKPALLTIEGRRAEPGSPPRPPRSRLLTDRLFRAPAVLLLAAAVAGGAASCSEDVGPLFPPDVSTSGDPPPPPPEPADIDPAPGGVRRLLARQYLGSVKVLLGDVGVAAADPPQDSQLWGLEAIAASQLPMAPSAVEKYELSARNIAAAAVADSSTLAMILPCTPAGANDQACFGEFVTEFGRMAWRRPLTAVEVSEVVTAAQIGAAANNTWTAGIESAISALLQSPYFLYLVEVGEPDAENPARRRLTPLELATRMSMFLINATPDLALLDAAESGGLDDNTQVRALAKAMLARPEAKVALADFHDEVFELRELDAVSKDPDLFPQFTAQLRDAMREETQRFLADIVWTRNADSREIFDGKSTFVNSDIAWLYGIQAPAGETYAKVTLPAAQHRAGILGQASFLTKFAHPNQTSPTRRGLFIQSVLLCTDIPPPPPGVNPNLPEDDGTPKTMKQKLAQHAKDPSCAACHGQMDGFGFALENYDAIGAFRVTDQGLPIDPTASMDGFGDFQSAEEIGALLRENPLATQCIVRNLFRQSMGHKELKGELPALLALDEAFVGADHRIQDILVELCASPAFQLVGEPK